MERLELPSPYGRLFSRQVTYQLAYTSSVALLHYQALCRVNNAEAVGLAERPLRQAQGPSLYNATLRFEPLFPSK